MSEYSVVGWSVDSALRVTGTYPPQPTRTLSHLIEENNGDPALLEHTRKALLGSPVECVSRWRSRMYTFTLIPMRTSLGAIGGVTASGRVVSRSLPLRLRTGTSDTDRLLHPADPARWLEAAGLTQEAFAGMAREAQWRVRSSQVDRTASRDLLLDPRSPGEALQDLCRRATSPDLRVTCAVPADLPPQPWTWSLGWVLEQLIEASRAVDRGDAKRPTWLRILAERVEVSAEEIEGWSKARPGAFVRIEVRCLPAWVLSRILPPQAILIYYVLTSLRGFGALNIHAEDEQPSLTLWLPLAPTSPPSPPQQAG